MSDAIFFAPLRVPVVDQRTGLMSREWYLFFQAMFMRIGGTQAFSADDLQLVSDMNEATDDGIRGAASIADALQLITENDANTVSVDFAALSQRVADLEAIIEPLDVTGNPQDVADSLLLSLAALDPDPVAQSGAFTPTVLGSSTAGAGTYTAQKGNYTRIGDRVFFNLRVTWSATTGTGNLQIGGLPIASNASANAYNALAIFYNGSVTTGQGYFAFLAPGNTFISVDTNIAGSGAAGLALPASGDVIMSGHYPL